MSYPVAYSLADCVDHLVEKAHGAARGAGWWDKPFTDETVPRCLMLVVSELSEAMEGDRKDLMDDKLPHRRMLEVELADAIIRIADLAGATGCDLGGAVAEKMEYNRTRADHQKEARASQNGKKY